MRRRKRTLTFRASFDECELWQPLLNKRGYRETWSFLIRSLLNDAAQEHQLAAAAAASKKGESDEKEADNGQQISGPVLAKARLSKDGRNGRKVVRSRQPAGKPAKRVGPLDNHKAAGKSGRGRGKDSQ